MAEVVCVGAHPDDVEIGMGGTVAALARSGADVLIVDLTDGEPTPFGTRERRLEEAAKAAAVLGCRRVTLDFPNRRLQDVEGVRRGLAEVLRKERPRMLFTPYPDDAHPDHVAASHICDAGRFYAKFSHTDMAGEPWFVPRLYRYVPIHLRLLVEPSFLSDVSATVDVKFQALEAYASQFRDNPANQGMLPQLRRAAAFYGDIGRVAAAEPLFATEPIVVGSVRDLA